MVKVSVIIPTIGRFTLNRAIESVINQSYKKWELLVINDQKEGSININFNHPQIYIHNNENLKGSNGARNTGIQKSLGEYVAFLDDDDEWHPHKLELQLQRMENDNSILSYTGKTIIEDDNLPRYVYRKYFFSPHLTLFFHNYIGTTSSVMIKKSIFNGNIAFDEKLNSVQDYDLYLRLLPHGKFSGIKMSLVTYYFQSNDHISTNIYGFIQSANRIFKKQYWYYKPLITLSLMIILLQKCFKVIKRKI